ncbi:MAG: alpha/beta hydrolase [Planctomycetota bacterium]
MKILFLHGWQSSPGGVKPTFLIDHGHEVINPKLDDEDFEVAVRTAQSEFDRHQPSVVVGSSRGGAVAMNIESSKTPLVLLCPAWKRWGTATKVEANTTILHSRSDDVIAFSDSEVLCNNSGLTSNVLIDIGVDHRLADPDPLTAMLKHCEKHIDSYRPKGSLNGLIQTLDEWQREWKYLQGWAPKEAAELLDECRLDWLYSLANALPNLVIEDESGKSTSGQLILGWAALGAILEGSMKFFLSVHASDYERSVKTQRSTGVFKTLWNQKTSDVKSPDGLMLEKLRHIFQSEIWDEHDQRNWSAWVAHIRDRRNSIHAYQDRDLGGFDELWIDVRILSEFVNHLNSCLPPLPDRDMWR